MKFMSITSRPSIRNVCRVATLAIAAVSLQGCADPALVQVSPGAYRIVKSDRLHFYRTTAELKSDAVREANDFAAARGMSAVAIASSEQPLVPGVEFATVKYQFRLVDKSDPEVRRMSVTLRPIDFDKVEGPSSAASASADIAALDEMRQRGVINNVEFMTMKARLLAPASAASTASATMTASTVAEPQPVKP